MIADLKPYPAYKDSGVPWLGEIPAHWAIERLKSSMINVTEPTAERQVGDLYVALEHVESWTGHLRQARSDVTFDSQVKRFRSGDVLFGKLRPYLAKVTRPRSDGVCVGEFLVLRPRGSYATAPYMEQLLRSKPVIDAINSSTFGAKMPRADWQFVGGMAVTLPPLSEQAAIVRYLDYVDRRIRRYIRAKQKLIALLNEQKQAIIHQAVTRGLDSVTPSAFQEEGDTPNIGVSIEPEKRISTAQNGIPWLTSIPDHWGVLSSRRLFSPRKERARPGDVQLSATQAYGVIPQADFEQKVGRRVVKIFLHLDKRRHVEKDDFIISMRSFQGGLERAWASGCIRSSYVVLKPISHVDIGYFAYLFKSHGYVQALQATSNFIRDGQDLNFNNFCLVDLPVVPLKEQKAIADFLDQATASINASISRACIEVDLLREYRTRLIADVVTGKLDVRAAAAALPDEGEEPEVLEAVPEEAEEGDESISEGEEAET